MENTSLSNKKRKKKTKYIILGLLLLFLLMCLVLNWYIKKRTGSSVYDKYTYAKQTIQQGSEADFRKNTVSVYYDSDGNRIQGAIEKGKITYLTYEEIPQSVIDSFVAIEDTSFWKNSGISPIGIIRAGLGQAGIGAGGGGSTITQQIVKLTYLSSEQTMDRKIKEIFMALQMSKKYSKKQIMEFYCNQVCFSNGIYGIENASEIYFGIPASQLTVSQAAYLCALPNRPTYYNPYEYPERALERRNLILVAMEEQGMISEQVYDSAIGESLVIKKPQTLVDGYQITYARECAIKYLMEYKKLTYDEAAEELDNGGYHIYTSLDSEQQQNIQNSVDTNLAGYSIKNPETGIYELQGAVVAMDNKTGKVTAIVGGRSQIATENAYTLNRAYQSYRQPGSSIKPLIVYTPAIMKGYDAEAFRTAVEQSTNSVATETFEQITPEYGLSFLKKMEFEKIVDTDYGLASALGGLTNGVTPVEMAGAYCVLANHGYYRPPTCITSMTTIDGEEIYQESEKVAVYEEQAADQMVDLMKGVFTKGTAKRLDWYGASDVEVAGKTGTTNDNKDGWLCGMSEECTLVVWAGCDTPQAMTDMEGSTYPGSIWKESMLQLLRMQESVDD